MEVIDDILTEVDAVGLLVLGKIENDVELDAFMDMEYGENCELFEMLAGYLYRFLKKHVDVF